MSLGWIFFQIFLQMYKRMVSDSPFLFPPKIWGKKKENEATKLGLKREREKERERERIITQKKNTNWYEQLIEVIL